MPSLSRPNIIVAPFILSQSLFSLLSAWLCKVKKNLRLDTLAYSQRQGNGFF